ncbi:MAG: cupin domain-containing protein, partial [Spartobacteria bacterium]|nr:cupin domain-containing protein [Spartobacteria bacterium]
EFDYVLKGRLTFRIKDQEIILEEGDSIYIDSSYPHSICAMDRRPARILAVIIPS